MMSALMAALLFLAQGRVYTFPDFVSVNGDSLKARYDNAIAQGRGLNSETFWVAWEMPGDGNTRTTLIDGIEVSQTRVPERAAMFFLARKSDGGIERIRIITLAQDIRVHDRPVYWLGKPASDESAGVLLDIARTTTSTAVRKDAIFWLGQEASRLVPGELEKLASNDPDTEVQKQAVFALSQRRNDESIPTLMRIARDHSNPAVRKQAIFWLGQSRDPRVLEFFEGLLKKK